jgi:uncharacterized protein YceK
MFSLSARPFLLASVLAVAVLLVGCGSTSLHRAPVEDRGTLAKNHRQHP